MRHALENLNPAPKVEDQNSDQHLYNIGLVQWDAGSIVIFMRVDRPGSFFLDQYCTTPASDAQARAAIPPADFARFRAEGVILEDDARIEEALASTSEPAPAVSELEAKKAKARKLIREQMKLTQAAADRALTRHLDAEGPVLS